MILIFFYSFQDSKISGFYFRAQDEELRLISCLLNSDKETEGDYLMVTGNWYLDRRPYPILMGRAGG